MRRKEGAERTSDQRLETHELREKLGEGAIRAHGSRGTLGRGDIGCTQGLHGRLGRGTLGGYVASICHATLYIDERRECPAGEGCLAMQRAVLEARPEEHARERGQATGQTPAGHAGTECR